MSCARCGAVRAVEDFPVFRTRGVVAGRRRCCRHCINAARPKTPRPDIATRLEAWSEPEPNSGCVIWLGARGSDGHGHLKVNNRSRPAHRVAYELVHGPVPPELHMDHLCRLPPCINDRHVEPVTPRVNTLRGVGITAVQARRTHCIYGHPFDEVNTYVGSDGFRNCRACAARTMREYRERRKLKARQGLTA